MTDSAENSNGDAIAFVRAILTDGNGRFLLLRRSPSAKHNPDCWEFPGGGMSQSESLGEALARELREELGLVIEPSRIPGAYVGLSTGEYPQGVLFRGHAELYGLAPVVVSEDGITAIDHWGFFTPEQALTLLLTPGAAAALEDPRLFPLTRS